MYYNYLLIMWRTNRLTLTQLQAAVTRNYITQNQADTIVATPREEG